MLKTINGEHGLCSCPHHQDFALAQLQKTMLSPHTITLLLQCQYLLKRSTIIKNDRKKENGERMRLPILQQNTA